MNRKLGGAVLAAGLAAGAAAVRAVVSAARPHDSHRSEKAADGNRWLVVTVNRPPEEVMPGGAPPEPLDGLKDAVEVRVEPAPGGRGSELAARPRGRVPTGVGEAAARLSGDDPRQAVRTALREAKSLLETGEVVRADRPSTTRDTPGGKIIKLATRRAGGEGAL